MAEQLKQKRIKFPLGKQKLFISEAKKSLNLTWTEMAKVLKVSVRTLTDWRKERYNMSEKAVSVLCKKTKKSFPKNIELLDFYWYTKKGARAGGLARYKKYGSIGNPEKRKRNWQKWWREKGRFKNYEIFKPFSFKKPKLSDSLAEFTGILLGDGGMTKNQITITLHCIDDKEYSDYVMSLIKKNFDLIASRCKKNKYNAFHIRISRTGLVTYFVNKLGLKTGNKVKQKVDIPEWIKNRRSFQISCLRGLVDTDGSFFIHKYISGKKEYAYLKIDFTSRSAPLLKSASDILTKLSINHRITNDAYSLRIEAGKDVKRYLELVGTCNFKNKKKLEILALKQRF